MEAFSRDLSLEELSYSCSKCKKRFFSQNTLNHHDRRKHYKRPQDHYCRLCHVTFSRGETLRNHVDSKHDTEDGSRKLSIVDRPVRQVVKLCDIEDSSLLDDITAVRKAAKKIIDARKVVPQSEIDDVITQEKGIITIEDSEADEIDNESTPVETLNKTKVKTK